MSAELAAPPVPGWPCSSAVLHCRERGCPCPLHCLGGCAGPGSALPGSPLVASAAPCSLCRSRSCTCLFLSGDTGTSSSVRLFGLHF